MSVLSTIRHSVMVLLLAFLYEAFEASGRCAVTRICVFINRSAFAVLRVKMLVALRNVLLQSNAF